MRFNATTLQIIATLIALTGCSGFRDRLLFVEETHLGLIARVSPDETAPADVDFGYRRSIVTLVPQENAQRTEPDGGYPSDYKFGDVLSVISSFNAKVRWFDATEIHTYFATGDAASQTGTNAEAIKALTSTTTK